MIKRRKWAKQETAHTAAEDKAINNKPGVGAEGEPSARPRAFRGWVTGAPEASLPKQEALEAPSWLSWLGVCFSESPFLPVLGARIRYLPSLGLASFHVAGSHSSLKSWL